MDAYKVLRAAAETVSKGWSQGANARDHDGREVPLWATGSSETGRASVNPAAVRFSLYAAVALAQAPGGVVGLPAMWDLLYRRCKEAIDAVPGGNNHVHPALGFNEIEGQTADKVVAMLELCANELEAGATVDPPFPMPDTSAIASKDAIQ